MVEHEGFCRHVRYHQQKLVFHLAAMRNYAAELEGVGRKVSYHALEDGPLSAGSVFDDIVARAKALRAKRLHVQVVADRWADTGLVEACRSAGLKLVTHANPVFLTSDDDFARWLDDGARLHQADFWRWQRRRHGLLMEPGGKPAGGRWSFDTDNRKPLPKGIQPPEAPSFRQGSVERSVAAMVAERFSDHIGRAEDCSWATTRAGASQALDRFLVDRFAHFGSYQDALTHRHDTVFHATISPYLNVGLLTPAQVVERSLIAAQGEAVPLASLEGFLRQVVGWREFVRGVDRQVGDQQDGANHWGGDRALAPCWWSGDSGLPPLDHLVGKVDRLAYGHHIERLMVAGNLMLLCDVAPQAGWRWFMEGFIDSADWVMGPNVYGMALNADGGLMTTKPYICGAAYWLRMGDWGKGPWCEGVNGLYWRFIQRNRAVLAANQRTRQAVSTLDRMDPTRVGELVRAGEDLRERLTRPAVQVAA
jgi:deoxyribodipyrimidine photolyase-related protein